MPKKKVVKHMWKNARGWHSNHIESVWSLLKRWARKRNAGRLPTYHFFHLYISNFMLKHNASLDPHTSVEDEVLNALRFCPPKPE